MLEKTNQSELIRVKIKNLDDLTRANRQRNSRRRCPIIDGDGCFINNIQLKCQLKLTMDNPMKVHCHILLAAVNQHICIVWTIQCKKKKLKTHTNQ